MTDRLQGLQSSFPLCRMLFLWYSWGLACLVAACTKKTKYDIIYNSYIHVYTRYTWIIKCMYILMISYNFLNTLRDFLRDLNVRIGSPTASKELWWQNEVNFIIWLLKQYNFQFQSFTVIKVLKSKENNLSSKSSWP